MDRRINPRARLIHTQTLWLNKYLEGFPHLAQVVELSEDGMLIRTIHEPLNRENTFTLELGIPGSAHRLWLRAERVRQMGAHQALRISYAALLDRAQLRQLVRWSAAA
jgi:hypothetical protein